MTKRKQKLAGAVRVAVLGLVVLAGFPHARAASRAFNMQDASSWTFFNGAWTDGPEGALDISSTLLHQDGPAMQGHHYAFFKPAAYQDLHAQFEIHLMGHTD